MNMSDNLQLQKDGHREAEALSKKKGADYANEDALANFKVASSIEQVLSKGNMGIPHGTPHGVAMTYMVLKLLRLLNMWAKGVDPQNESLHDTYIDIDNYLYRMKACYEDWKNEQ